MLTIKSIKQINVSILITKSYIIYLEKYILRYLNIKFLENIIKINSL